MDDADHWRRWSFNSGWKGLFMWLCFVPTEAWVLQGNCNFHFRSALQSISDTLLGLLIHANECVDPFNDSSFYKTLLLSCFQGLTQTKSFASKLPSNLVSDNLTLQNPLALLLLFPIFFSYSHFQALVKGNSFPLFVWFSPFISWAPK